MNIARAIRTTRLSREVSQQALAQRIGISPSYLSLLEGGKKEPSLAMIRAIAEGLGISDDVLILSAIDYSKLNSNTADVLYSLVERVLGFMSEAPERRAARKRKK